MHNPTKDEIDNDPEINTIVSELENSHDDVDDVDDEDEYDEFDVEYEDDFEYDDDDEDDLDSFERIGRGRRGEWDDDE